MINLVEINTKQNLPKRLTCLKEIEKSKGHNRSESTALYRFVVGRLYTMLNCQNTV